ncbi:quinol oxidase [Crenobacter cavernae]|uniref:Quinol oxidase n=2 Tax=Crenobacter cavernae TaxID=2290923 RepID=A0ABY0FBE0_9NEIS|nr:quinol oxidase [Crenobacter cavernae]
MGLMSAARLAALSTALVALQAVAEGEGAPYRPTPGADGVQRVDIVGGSYHFKPKRIAVKVGQPVEVSVHMDSGIVPHRFVLEGPGGKRIADFSLGDAPQKVTFTPAVAGRYVFYCPNRLLFFKSHRERGMVGELDAEE